MTPKPLSPIDWRLRDRRFQVWVGGDRKPNGAIPCIAEGRFASFNDAKAWADEDHADAPFVNITFLTARTCIVEDSFCRVWPPWGDAVVALYAVLERYGYEPSPVEKAKLERDTAKLAAELDAKAAA